MTDQPRFWGGFDYLDFSINFVGWSHNDVQNMMLSRTTSVSFRSGKLEYTLSGRSRAGDGTSFALQELKWLFDCGALIEGWTPKVVFLTHTHSDHVHFLTRLLSDENPPIVYLPVEAEALVKEHLIAYKKMTDCDSPKEPQTVVDTSTDKPECVFRPTWPGDEITFRQGGKDFVVRPLKMDHRVPCLGYSIFKVHEKLKKEYEGLPGKEIGRLRKTGVVVTESQEEPFLCFLGDTTDNVFRESSKVLKQHKVIVVECSFIDKDSIDRARDTTHMHWENLRTHVESNHEVMFILTHFSLKYSSLELRNFFCQQQERYDNIHPMLVEEEIEEIWARRKNDSNPSSTTTPPKCLCRICKPRPQTTLLRDAGTRSPD